LTDETVASPEQKLSCICRDGVVSLLINGKQYFDQSKPAAAPTAKDPVEVHEDGRVGFALRYASKKNITSIQNIKVRRIFDGQKAKD
jgi:hypothetical protein